MRPNLPSKQREAQIETLAKWHSKPKAMREYSTVTELAEAHGWETDKQFVEMAEYPEVHHSHILKIAGAGLEHVSEILEALYKKAITGHVKAAETYLEWHRKLITDAKVIERVAPAVNPNEVLNTAIEGAHKLMQVAAAVPSEEEAKKAVEADFYES